ncbi:low-density lipoprotein receptor-related protein 11 [Pseudophryne corroboree]|uniref:low-density lipoprotein receptor-related protein 11 n=1 Tax=Pseudophryne corroboree TaxID=495146 RepID=UPI003081700B
MIYPFPASHHPVLGIRPVISCLSILSLLLYFDSGTCRRASPGSPAPQLTDLRSQITGVEELLEEFRKQLQQQRQQQEPQNREHTLPAQQDRWQGSHRQQHGDERDAQQDAGVEEEETMQKELQEVGVRPAGDVGEDLCNFNQMEDYIIRTKDSLEAGATFLKAPTEVYSMKQCLEACCSQPGCSAAVVETSSRGLSCFLFACASRGRSVCQFSPHRDYNSYTLADRNASSGWAALRTVTETDKPPHSNAGQDVVLQLPDDWVILDGRESNDDHGIILYEWTLLRGDRFVDMKVPQPGTLKLSHLQEGFYSLQLTVTDTSGQIDSDNISVNVLPAEHHKSASSACTGDCTRYQFICDDGCCIDITLACDGIRQCPDGSDEAFCQNLNSGRKTVVHISENTDNRANEGRVIDTKQNSGLEKSKLMGQNTFESTNAEKDLTLPQELTDNSIFNKGSMERRTTLDPRGDHEKAPGTVSSKLVKDAEDFFIFKHIPKGNGHLAPATGAVLPLALGLAITALMLLMIVCRLQFVKQKMKKAHLLASEESDYLINGMYM